LDWKQLLGSAEGRQTDGEVQGERAAGGREVATLCSFYVRIRYQNLMFDENVFRGNTYSKEFQEA